MNKSDRTKIGIVGLDNILNGGLPKGQMYLVEGAPGTGKTTIALQFCLEGVRSGERSLYVTLSESRDELLAVAASRSWSLDGVSIVEFIPDESSLEREDHYTVFHPSEVELAGTIRKLLGEIERINPVRVVIDSLSEFRLLAAEPVRFRRQLLALKKFFSGRQMTTLLLDDRSDSTYESHVRSIAHGVIRLEKSPRTYGIARRQLEILKIRGSAYREGLHDYKNSEAGLEVFPRLIAAEHESSFKEETLPSGIAALDAMFGGGVDRGSSVLILGPTGVGKSSVSMQFAVASALRGERTLIYTFDETSLTARRRAVGIGQPVEAMIAKGILQMTQVDPAELTPGEFVVNICKEAEKQNARVVILDSLNGFVHSMPGEKDLALQLHELLTYLGARGVSTFLVLTQHGVAGEMVNEIDVSYLADNVLVIRFFEARASVRRAISVLKKRSGPHENTIRELTISSAGIQIGDPLIKFRGILTRTPETRAIADEQDLTTT